VAALVLLLGVPACADPAQLTPGAPLQREIAVEEVHSYPVDLTAGDFLRVQAGQEGVDIGLTLLAPDGHPVLLVDGPGPVFDYGTEDLAAVADTSGLYQILVRASLKNEPRARYTIRMETPRPAREDDRRRVEAVRLNQEATNGMGASQTLQKQAELREQALRIWHGLGETAREADTLFQLGIVRFNLGQAEKASPLLHHAADLYGQAGDRVGQAKALNQAGLLCEQAGDTEDALKEYQQALDLARQAGARWPQVNALTNVARLLNRRGKPREAVSILEQALTLTAGLACQGCRGGVLIGRGSAYDDLGDPQKAIGDYKEALKLPDLPPGDRGAALNNLGLDLLSLGNLEEALESFQRAQEVNPNPSTLINQGIALERLNRVEEALAQYEKALGLARQGVDLRAQVYTLHAIGNLALKMGQKEKAVESWRKVQDLAEGHKELALLALFTRGLAHRESGDLSGARRDLERSLSLSRERGDRGWESLCELELSQAERKDQRLREALAHLKAAVAIVESQRNQIRNPNLRATYLRVKQSFYELTIATLMDLHRREPAAGWDAQALQASERARARGLLDLLAEIRTDLRKGVDPKLLEKEAELRAEINARDLRRQELSHQGASAEDLGRADAGLEEALSDFDEVETELRKSSPAYAALTQPEPLDAAAIQSRVLGAGSLLLEYSLGEEKSYLWAVSPTAVRSFELPGRIRIETMALDVYDKLTRQDSDPAAADQAALELSRTVLGPVEGMLTGGTLLVVSDGMLQYIPFSALPLPSSPHERLLARQQVVSLPSASTLAVLRDELRDRPLALKTVAILANPVFRPDDPRIAKARRSANPALASAHPSAHRGLPPRGPGGTPGATETGRVDTLSLEELPWSKEEADAIARMVPDPSQKLIALDFDASVDTVLSGRLSDYRYVHFATHGLLDTAHPALTSLALSRFDRTGKPQETSSLRLQDIYNLQLNADLVVLSACQTALGKEIRGEGLMGLTRGFMYAGAARVLASLWSVEDRATSKLMEKFYRYLLVQKLPPAEALRRAQLDLANDPRWSRPYYWAGFSLQGEWR
jgi:CHAT domain-containing protein/tetratricopeptide (TPR) repeat protein